MKHEEKDSMENFDFIFSGDEKSYEKIPLTDMTSPGNPSDEPKGPPIGGILSVILGVLSIVAAYGWITGSWDAEYAIPTIIVVLVGSVVAFFTAETFVNIFLTIEIVGAILFWVIAAISDIISMRFSILEFLGVLLVGWIASIPLCAFPALICAVLVTVLKKIICAL